MAENHHVAVEPGDRVLIDLGGYGVEILLDQQRRFYDERYVGIEYVDDGSGEDIAEPYCIPADLVVMKGRAEQVTEQADGVRIWRHGPEAPSGGG